MKVKIYRFDYNKDQEGYFDEFEVPVPQEENWTVMDVLDYISFNMDSSIRYYKHSVCNHGICGRCTLKVNGRVKMACICVANEYDKLILEPMPNRKIIKDLVTQKG
ncbi:2Fe-2S iron-sulfur cluster-binding protein [Irregularibacter muris]|uniref:2Fe-2S iron-sulfur cluster-binding protein n=1 Tax=Irregularibacter muris TaxID=1796619 RepID=A0AAE3KZU4_9FIRM|nr:2Fe-2S iron-sulfur cluster-binding protein [Irregularibacter muris]MCR1899745.1 2Fe-2S iron-sulfur cluster-binding protein [Irregularibacter muris]